MVVSRTSVRELGPSILALLPRWASILMCPGVASTAGAPTSSVLERAVHVRDLVGGVAVRLGGMLHEGHPLLADWSGHGGATTGAPAAPGAAPDPVQVAVDIEDAGRAVAARLRALTLDSVPREEAGAQDVPAAVVVLARRVVHDLSHHLHEVNA